MFLPSRRIDPSYIRSSGFIYGPDGVRWTPAAPPPVNNQPDDIVRQLTQEKNELHMLYSEANRNLGRADLHINTLQDSLASLERKVELT